MARRGLSRFRRPRFAVVLVGMLLPVAVLLLLLSGGSSKRPQPSQPAVIGSGPTRACVSATAQAQAVVRTPVSATASVAVPVTVTETAHGRRGTFAATRGVTVVERASASRAIQITQPVAVIRRACARGSSLQAARGRALRLAYAKALRSARARAPRAAQRRLRALVAQTQPGVLAGARKLAQARAQRAAVSTRATLKRQALAQARAQAR